MRPFAGDVRMSYKEMKGELHNYWLISCNERNRNDLSVELDIWEENIFINERFSGRKKNAKLYYKVIDPTNLEFWLIYNREQNPFGGLNLNLDIPNQRYHKLAGTRA